MKALNRNRARFGVGRLAEGRGGASRSPRGEQPPLRGIRGRIARRRDEEARRSRKRLLAIAAAVGGGLLLAVAAVWLLTRPKGDAGNGKGPGDSRPIASPARDVTVVPVPAGYTDVRVGRLAEQLRSQDLASRVEAADTLARLGPRAYEAVPALLNAMARSSSEIEFSRAVGKAMKAIGPAALPALIEALRSAVGQARFHAASALARLGADAAPAVNALTNVLENDPDYSVRANPAMALGAVGPAATTALPALRRAAGDPSQKYTGDAARDQLRDRARMAMYQIRGGPGK